MAVKTVRHLAVSDLIVRSVSAIDGGSIGISPMFEMRCCISGAVMICFISALSRSTTGFGVPARATSMCHATTSKSAAPTASANGRISGCAGSRCADDTASARSLPSRISASEAPASAKAKSMWPEPRP
jgi:hypothetical protein